MKYPGIRQSHFYLLHSPCKLNFLVKPDTLQRSGGLNIPFLLTTAILPEELVFPFTCPGPKKEKRVKCFRKLIMPVLIETTIS